MPVEFRGAGRAALKSLTVTAPDGAIIGVVGQRSSGVSDLLQIVGGVAQPERGEIRAGNHRRYLTIGDQLTLAPSHVIALDQALAAQDALVRARTLAALDRLCRAGTTVFLATHEEPLLETLCDEVWWLEAGELAAKGEPREIITRYRRFIEEQVRSWGETLPPRISPMFRHGDGRAEIIAVETLGAQGQPTIAWKSGEYVGVRVRVLFQQAVEDPVISLLIRTRIGIEVYGTDTRLEGLKIGPCLEGQPVTLRFQFLCDLCPQSYTLTLASQDPDGTVHEWLDDAVAFIVIDERPTLGIANLRAKVSIE